MATSGSWNTTKYTTSSSGTIGLNLSWTLKSQSIEDNTSTISYTLKSNGTMSSGYYIKAGPVTLRMNGTNLINITSRFDMKGGGAWKKTGNITIQHDSDGSKTFTGYVTAALYSTSVNVWTGNTNSYYVTETLPKINRYALLDSVESFTDEVGTNGYPTIVYSNPAGTSLVTGLKARITWNNGANYTDWVTLNDEGGTYTFTSSTLKSANISSMLSACTTSNTLPIQFDLQSTMGGVDYHDYKDAVMTVVNADPTSQSLSYLDVNSNVVDYKTHDSSIIVQSQSTLRIRTTPSTAKKGATIASYSLNINNNDYTPTISGGYVYVDFVNPSLSGTFLATMTTTDSRGNTSTATTNVIVQAWEPPIALFTLSRVNGFYTNTTLYVDASMSPVSNTNSMTIQEQHRKFGSSTWSTAATVQNKTNTTIALDNSYAWEMQILVTDEYATTTYGATVGKGIPILFIDKKNSIGVNGYPDADNQIYVDGTVKATGDIEADGVKLHDKIQQVTLTQNISVSSASGYFQLSDNLDYPRSDAILIGMTVNTASVGATAGTIYQLIYWENGARPYVQYQRGSSSFSGVSHSFIFTFYLP